MLFVYEVKYPLMKHAKASISVVLALYRHVNVGEVVFASVCVCVCSMFYHRLLFPVSEHD